MRLLLCRSLSVVSPSPRHTALSQAPFSSCTFSTPQRPLAGNLDWDSEVLAAANGTLPDFSVSQALFPAPRKSNDPLTAYQPGSSGLGLGC